MAHLGLPVPPGFTITTEVCTYFHENGKTYPKNFKSQVEAALAEVGRITGKKFGDGENPLLVSVRSGARASMPGMMDTVLNLGLNDVTVAALAARSGDRRFAYDSYRRFITMYADVVLGIAHHHFEEILDEHKDRNGYTLDTDLDAADWEQLIARFRERVKEESGAPFPRDPHAQLWGAIGAVFGSWMNRRAITYRRLYGIPESGGTAVNVQAMVFGNMGETSATGVAFTRNPSTGEKILYGESSMRRAKTWLAAFAARRRSPKQRAMKRAPTSLRWRRRCRKPSPSSSASMPRSSGITATCRTSSSRWSRASCGCCRRAAASAPPRPRCASPSSWRRKN
jgi:pyruvate,orthophosphate dikinase